MLQTALSAAFYDITDLNETRIITSNLNKMRVSYWSELRTIYVLKNGHNIFGKQL